MFVVHGSPVDKESIDIDGCFKVTVFFFPALIRLSFAILYFWCIQQRRLYA